MHEEFLINLNKKDGKTIKHQPKVHFLNAWDLFSKTFLNPKTDENIYRKSQ